MRNSDRLVTPAVVIFFLLVAGGCVLATIAAVTWLTAHGRDPEPMLKLVGLAVTAATSLGGFLLQLSNRATLAKTERTTGLELPALRAELEANTDDTRQLGAALERVADALPRPVPRHSYPDHTTLIGNGAAPAPRGS